MTLGNHIIGELILIERCVHRCHGAVYTHLRVKTRYRER